MKSYAMMPKDRKKPKSKFRWWALIAYVSVTNKSPVLFVARESVRVGARGPHSMSLSATPPPMDPQSMSAESGLLGPLLSLEELSRLRRKLGLDKCVPKKTLKQCVPTAPLYPHTPEYESELHDVVCIGEKRGLRNVSPLCELLRALPVPAVRMHDTMQFFWHIGSGFSGFTWPLRYLRQVLDVPPHAHVYVTVLDRDPSVPAQVSVDDEFHRNVTVIRCRTTQGCDAAAVINELNMRVLQLTGRPLSAPAMLILDTCCYSGASARMTTASEETRSQSPDNSLAYSLLLWLKVIHATVGLPQCAMMKHNMRDAESSCWTVGIPPPTIRVGNPREQRDPWRVMVL